MQCAVLGPRCQGSTSLLWIGDSCKLVHLGTKAIEGGKDYIRLLETNSTLSSEDITTASCICLIVFAGPVVVSCLIMSLFMMPMTSRDPFMAAALLTPMPCGHICGIPPKLLRDSFWRKWNRLERIGGSCMRVSEKLHWCVSTMWVLHMRICSTHWNTGNTCFIICPNMFIFCLLSPLPQTGWNLFPPKDIYNHI